MNFKLPNFLNWELLNTLRHEMSAPLTESFVLDVHFKQIDIPIVERLRNAGIDVNIDDIKIHDDGTLIYNGFRVLLYIRDISSIAGQTRMPKYHFSYCKALETMQKNSRFGRYVVANRDSGEFQVNVMDSNIKTQTVRLNVCQNCLDTIRWKGFDMQKMARPMRLNIVSHFSLLDFFREYPRDLVNVKPIHTSDTAPVNTYTDDWAKLSRTIKLARGQQCKTCRIVLQDSESKYLHLHHRNGLKYDNSEANLDVLCIACHAEQPMHGHIKVLPDYKEFLARHQC
ncbi:MAG: HNH endonuclease [Enterobacter sp.]|jgi:hypothetical protein|nr:HNH endonuclease [Enterobacter sp.]